MLTRMEAMSLVLHQFPDQPIIANCGATARELAALKDAPQHLYLLDSMGQASSVGLGLALALAESAHERVIVFEGDGSLLMNLGSLASIGYHRPAKLLLVLLDNESYASTGGQPTYAAQLELAALAQAAGIATLTAANEAGLIGSLREVDGAPGPIFLHVKIAAGNHPDVPLLLEDPALIGARFKEWLSR